MKRKEQLPQDANLVRDGKFTSKAKLLRLPLLHHLSRSLERGGRMSG